MPQEQEIRTTYTEDAPPSEDPLSPEARLRKVIEQAVALRSGQLLSHSQQIEGELAIGQEHFLPLLREGQLQPIVVTRTKPDAMLFTLDGDFPKGKLVIMGDEALTTAQMEHQTARIIFAPDDGTAKQVIGWSETRGSDYVFPTDLNPLALAERIFANIPARAELSVVPGSSAQTEPEVSRGRSHARSYHKSL